MTEASYRAWDDNLYEWPPPDGWYEATDGKWWPDGYGPGGKVAGTAAQGGGGGGEDRDDSPPGSPDRSGGGAGFDPGKTSVLPAGGFPGGGASAGGTGQQREPAAGEATGDGTAGTGFDPGKTSVLPAGSPTAGPGQGGGGAGTFDPESTSTCPAGNDDDLSDLTFQPRTPEERLAEEARRRVYEDLPSIDDVFGGGDDDGHDDETPTRSSPEDLSLDDIPGLGVDPEVTTPPRSAAAPAPSAPAPRDGSTVEPTAPVAEQVDHTSEVAPAPPAAAPPSGPAPAPPSSPPQGDGPAPLPAPPVDGAGSPPPSAPPERGPVVDGGPLRPAAPAFGEETQPYDPFRGIDDDGGYGPPPGRGAATLAVSGEALSGLAEARDGMAGPAPFPGPDPYPVRDRDAAPVADIGSRWRVGEGAGRPPEPPPHQDHGWPQRHDEPSDGRPVSGPLGEYRDERVGQADHSGHADQFDHVDGSGHDQGYGGRDSVDADQVEMESGSRGGLLVALIALAVLAAIGVAAVAVFRDRGDGDDAGGEDAAVEGGLGNPYGFGTAVVVYYEGATGEELRWVVRVVDPVEDATRRLISEAAAPEPADGDVYAVTRVEVTYQSGPDPAAATDLVIGAATADGTRLTSAADGCPTVPDALDLGSEFSPTNSTSGNLCWVTSAGSLDGMVLTIEAGPAEGTVHLALNGAPATADSGGEGGGGDDGE